MLPAVQPVRIENKQNTRQGGKRGIFNEAILGWKNENAVAAAEPGTGAGADSDQLFGNEYDEIAVELCRKRLNRCCDILNKPHIKNYQIHQGNALGKWCLTDFSEEYLTKFDPQYIDDENYINNKQKQVSLF